jgi:hypothetical protein
VTVPYLWHVDIIIRDEQHMVELAGFDIPSEKNDIQDIFDEAALNCEEKSVSRFEVVVNGSKVMMEGSQRSYIFVDIFNFIDFDIKKGKGNIVLKLNGKSASYTDIIGEGDVIEVYWEN